jgi:hypothetical protein
MNTFRSGTDRDRAIAELAYYCWEERGCPEGAPEEDWYKAELAIDREQNLEQGKQSALPALNQSKSSKKKKKEGVA